MPKCPVCKSEVHPGSKECCVCGFTELNAEFLNIEEAEIWQKQVVEPCKAIWQRSAQNKYRKMGKFEVVGTTLIKYNYNHLEADSLILIPYGITTISSWAFNKVHAGYVILPETVSNIEKYAFGNSIIEHLYIPSSVTHIGMHALGNREGTNVYLDFLAPNPNWGEKYGFDFPCEWGAPFYDWRKFTDYSHDSDFSSAHGYVRCFWKNEWVDMLHGDCDDSTQLLCLPSKKELLIAEKGNYTISYNGYFLSEGEPVYDENSGETETTTLYVRLLVNNRTNLLAKILPRSFEGIDLKVDREPILVRPNTLQECFIKYTAIDEYSNNSLLALDTEFPNIPNLSFLFDFNEGNGKRLCYRCNLSRLININAPGKGLNLDDLEKAKKQNYSI